VRDTVIPNYGEKLHLMFLKGGMTFVARGFVAVRGELPLSDPTKSRLGRHFGTISLRNMQQESVVLKT